jgi:hypothetical protein
MSDGNSSSIAVQLEKLQALRAAGSINEAEFQKLKSALMDQAVPKRSGLSASMIGAAVAIVVVLVVVLFAMPRHAGDKEAAPVAQTSAQPAMPSAAKAQTANSAANPPADATAAMPAGAATNDAANPPATAEPPPTYPTSFDCNQAQRLALRMICSDPNLAAQDMQLAALYRRARANAIDSSQLFDQQQEWLAARDSCRSAGCLATVYAQRRAELAQWITH